MTNIFAMVQMLAKEKGRPARVEFALDNGIYIIRYEWQEEDGNINRVETMMPENLITQMIYPNNCLETLHYNLMGKIEKYKVI